MTATPADMSSQILNRPDILAIMEADASGLLDENMIRLVERTIIDKLRSKTVKTRARSIGINHGSLVLDEGDVLDQAQSEAWEAMYFKMKTEVADFDTQAGLTGFERVAKHLDILISQAAAWDVVQMQLLKCEPSLKDHPGQPGNVAADAIERVYHTKEKACEIVNDVAASIDINPVFLGTRGIEKIEALKSRATVRRNAGGVVFECSPNTINYQGYNAAGDLVAMCTRSSQDVMRDTFLIDAALMFDDAGRRGVNIVEHKVNHLYLSTVPSQVPVAVQKI